MACEYCSGTREEIKYDDGSVLIIDQFKNTWPMADGDIDLGDEGRVFLGIQSSGFAGSDVSFGDLFIDIEAYDSAPIDIVIYGGEIGGTEIKGIDATFPFEATKIRFDVNFCPICGEDLRKPKTATGQEAR